MILSTPNDLIEMENQVKKLTQDLEQMENERFELELQVVELKKGKEEGRNVDLIGLEDKVKKLSINLERKEVQMVKLKEENEEKTFEIEQMKQLQEALKKFEIRRRKEMNSQLTLPNLAVIAS